MNSKEYYFKILTLLVNTIEDNTIYTQRVLRKIMLERGIQYRDTAIALKYAKTYDKLRYQKLGTNYIYWKKTK